MSLWQRKNIKIKKNVRAIGLSLIIHGVIISLLLLVITRQHHDALRITMRPPINTAVMVIDYIEMDENVATSVVDEKKITEPAKKHDTASKVISKQTKKIAKPVANNRPPVKKQQKPVQTKKNVIAQTKKIPEVKKNPSPKKTIIEQSIVTQPVVQPRPIIAQVPIQTLKPINQNELFNSQPIDKPDCISGEQYQELQRIIYENWNAPPGMEQHCSCEISFLIDAQGNARGILMVTSSGVLMFDVTARAAIQKTKFPRWAWGKPIIFMFKP